MKAGVQKVPANDSAGKQNNLYLFGQLSHQWPFCQNEIQSRACPRVQIVRTVDLSVEGMCIHT